MTNEEHRKNMSEFINTLNVGDYLGVIEIEENEHHLNEIYCNHCNKIHHPEFNYNFNVDKRCFDGTPTDKCFLENVHYGLARVYKILKASIYVEYTIFQNYNSPPVIRDISFKKKDATEYDSWSKRRVEFFIPDEKCISEMNRMNRFAETYLELIREFNRFKSEFKMDYESVKDMALNHGDIEQDLNELIKYMKQLKDGIWWE